MKNTNYYTVTEAKAQLSKLLADVERGETIAIARGSKVIAHLVSAGEAQAKPPRKLGAWAGQVRESADCWADDSQMAELFEGNDEMTLAAETSALYGFAEVLAHANSTAGTAPSPSHGASPTQRKTNVAPGAAKNQTPNAPKNQSRLRTKTRKKS